MRTTTTLATFLLLPLFQIASSIPIVLHSSGRPVEIWVTKFNTLNATTWNGAPHYSASSDTQATTETSKNGAELSAIGVVLEDTNGDLQISSKRTTSANGTINSNSTGRTKLASNGTQTIPSTSGTKPQSKGTGSSLTNTTGLSWNQTISRNNTVGLSWNQTTSLATALSDATVAAAATLQIDIVNNLPSSNVKVYISGLDPNGALIMLGQSGGWEYPTTPLSTPQPVAANVALSLGAPNTTTTFTLPGCIVGARVWIADGSLQFYVVATPFGPGLVEPAAVNPNDPNSEVNYAFAELTWGQQSGLYADITAVDFVGLPLGIQLVDTDNKIMSVLGTPSNAAPVLCDRLTAQSDIDGRAWNQLCATDSKGDLIRVLAPSNLISQNSNDSGTYYSRYVNDVWNHYRNNDLIINTQTTLGNVTCRVQGKLLQCNGDNRGYAKPNNADIFGCNSGPFAIQTGDNAIHYAVVPRLCAAFNRGTLLVPVGNVQPSLPSSRYYKMWNRPTNTRPKNWYSQLVHEMEVESKGYAFSYDDVAPSVQQDQSGLVSSTNPKVLRIIVGGT